MAPVPFTSAHLVTVRGTITCESAEEHIMHGVVARAAAHSSIMGATVIVE